MSKYKAAHYEVRIKQFGDYLCRELAQIQSDSPDPWYRHERRRALQDALLGMQDFLLINDYDMTAGVTVRTDSDEPLFGAKKED